MFVPIQSDKIEYNNDWVVKSFFLALVILAPLNDVTLGSQAIRRKNCRHMDFLLPITRDLALAIGELKKEFEVHLPIPPPYLQMNRSR